MAEESIEGLSKKVASLEQKLQSYESPGKTKLFYALQRNMNDLADMLNGIKLKEVDIDDPKNKTMERLKMIWASIASLSATLQVLGESSGITGDEKADMAKKTSFLDKYAN
jgi:hypothetical protein